MTDEGRKADAEESRRGAGNLIKRLNWSSRREDKKPDERPESEKKSNSQL
jgi:hypothetical protein